MKGRVAIGEDVIVVVDRLPLGHESVLCVEGIIRVILEDIRVVIVGGVEWAVIDTRDGLRRARKGDAHGDDHRCRNWTIGLWQGRCHGVAGLGFWAHEGICRKSLQGARVNGPAVRRAKGPLTVGMNTTGQLRRGSVRVFSNYTGEPKGCLF